MEDAVSNDSTELMRSLLLALDAGSEAEEAVKGISIPRSLPGGTNRFFVDGIVARWQRKKTLMPGTDQVRRSCLRVDEFALPLSDRAGRINDDSSTGAASSASEWSKRLWESNSNAAAVYNEVRATLALLNQYRVNVILERPLADPEA